jgi:hypothetical protein
LHFLLRQSSRTVRRTGGFPPNVWFIYMNANLYMNTLQIDELTHRKLVTALTFVNERGLVTIGDS